MITDMVLPDINGLKLLEVIKSKYPNLPVIIITGYGNEVTPDEVTARHGDGYLSKPFLTEELADVLGKVAPPKTASPQAIAEPALKTSVSAYAMIKVKEGGDVLRVFNKLYFMDNVLYCDAVRNSFDIVLLLNAATPPELDHTIQTKIKILADIDEVVYCPVAKPKLETGIQDFINDYESRKASLPRATNRNGFPLLCQPMCLLRWRNPASTRSTRNSTSWTMWSLVIPPKGNMILSFSFRALRLMKWKGWSGKKLAPLME